MKKTNIFDYPVFNSKYARKLLKSKYSSLLAEIHNGVYIFGTGLLGMFAKQEFQKNAVTVLGFIDNDVSKQNTEIMDIIVTSIKEVEPESIVIIASLWWYEIKEQLICNGFTRIIHYEELSLMECGFDVYGMNFRDMFQYYEHCYQDYQTLYSSLGDDKSKEVLELIMKYRWTLDVNLLKEAYDMSIKDGKQYFDKVITPHRSEVFVDCGGFMGDSSMDFLEWCHHEFSQIFFFEPDLKNMKGAMKNLEHVKEQVKFYNAGVGRRKETLYFNSDQNGSSRIMESGKSEIDIVNLDSIKIPVTFLKCDIEGAEMAMLEGAKDTICIQKPRIAISVYHRPEDLFEIQKFIYSLNSKYRFYLRHYTSSYCDTVLYCV